jgi:nucleotide-binding universal stress UspA family protein
MDERFAPSAEGAATRPVERVHPLLGVGAPEAQHRPGGRRPMTIVVGYVPTTTGLSAITEAAREARAREAEVVVVNAVGEAGYAVPTAAQERDLDAVNARLAAHGIKSSLHQVNAETSAAGVILEVARARHASLIVLGMHQRSWLAKRLLGSTVRSVALGAMCPVLVVPDVDEHVRSSEPHEAPRLPGMGQ